MTLTATHIALILASAVVFVWAFAGIIGAVERWPVWAAIPASTLGAALATYVVITTVIA